MFEKADLNLKHDIFDKGTNLSFDSILKISNLLTFLVLSYHSSCKVVLDLKPNTLYLNKNFT